MVQTIIRPKQAHVNVEFDLPDDFIGREIKVTFSAVEEEVENKEVKWGDFLGILSIESGASIQAEIEKMRNEWERDI